MWILFAFMGMSVSSILPNPSTEAPFIMESFVHILVFSIGIYAQFRKSLDVTRIFSLFMVFVVLLDGYKSYTELDQAYNDRFLPFNYPILCGIDLYLLFASLKFASTIKGLF